MKPQVQLNEQVQIWKTTYLLYSSRKNPNQCHGRSSENPRGRGFLEVKILEAKDEAKLEFPGGMGEGLQNKKTFYGSSIDISRTAHCITTVCSMNPSMAIHARLLSSKTLLAAYLFIS